MTRTESHSGTEGSLEIPAHRWVLPALRRWDGVCLAQDIQKVPPGPAASSAPVLSPTRPRCVCVAQYVPLLLEERDPGERAAMGHKDAGSGSSLTLVSGFNSELHLMTPSNTVGRGYTSARGGGGVYILTERPFS